MLVPFHLMIQALWFGVQVLRCLRAIYFIALIHAKRGKVTIFGYHQNNFFYDRCHLISRNVCHQLERSYIKNMNDLDFKTCDF